MLFKQTFSICCRIFDRKTFMKSIFQTRATIRTLRIQYELRITMIGCIHRHPDHRNLRFLSSKHCIGFIAIRLQNVV